MALHHESISSVSESSSAVVEHHDIEFEIGALASRHGISTDEARAIVEHCGDNLDCIDDAARELKLKH